MPLRRWVIAVVTFLVIAGGLILAVSHYYLLPAMSAAGTATPEERKGLAAVALLVMFVLLFVLLAVLLLLFRIGRFVFPGRERAGTPTQYTDAWAESARRMEMPPAEDDADHER